jgi:hypothetical protein
MGIRDVGQGESGRKNAGVICRNEEVYVVLIAHIREAIILQL